MGRPLGFVVMSNQRSGSSVFCRLMDGNPEVICRQEFLRSYKSRGVDLFPFLDGFYNPDRVEKAIGFKIQYSHVNKDVERYLEERKLKIIQMIREDLLEVALWYPRKHDGPTSGGLGPPLILKDGGKVTANISKVINYMKWLRMNIDRWNEKADYVVSYDEVTGNKDTRVFHDEEKRSDIYKFLGVQDCVTAVHEDINRKPARPPNKECVVNWDELLGAVDEANISRYWTDAI